MLDKVLYASFVGFERQVLLCIVIGLPPTDTSKCWKLRRGSRLGPKSTVICLIWVCNGCLTRWVICGDLHNTAAPAPRCHTNMHPFLLPYLQSTSISHDPHNTSNTGNLGQLFISLSPPCRNCEQAYLLVPIQQDGTTSFRRSTQSSHSLLVSLTLILRAKDSPCIDKPWGDLAVPVLNLLGCLEYQTLL
jgi:hypothetical protein